VAEGVSVHVLVSVDTLPGCIRTRTS